MLQEYIKRIIIEAISTDASYKQHIKLLFEQWVNKFSASYVQYREQNYPGALTVHSVSYAEDWKHQYVKLLFREKTGTDYALIFEHKGSIYVANDKTGVRRLAFFTNAATPGAVESATYWQKKNYLFKLSVSEFENALGVADNYEEFIALCKQLNEQYEQDEDE